MARPKLQYKNKTEQNQALESTYRQFQRAVNSLADANLGSSDSKYWESQRNAYTKKSNGKKDGEITEKAWDFAVRQENLRSNQLAEAFEKRVNAIKSASIANNAG